MEQYTYRNLDLWKQARALNREVFALVRGLPKSIASDVIARQIIRSSTSIAANISEGHGRFTAAAFRNHLQIARGSATETDNWLVSLLDAGLIDEATEVRLHRDCLRLIGALTNRIKSLGAQLQAKGSRVREEGAVYATSGEPPLDDDLFDSSLVQLPTEANDDYVS